MKKMLNVSNIISDMFLCDLYDTSGKRYLSPMEVMDMFEDIHGKVAIKGSAHVRR